ncbi:MAG: hypothetical protein IPM88_08095 [Nitrospira sp.]|nr:hypothetical protein [Nitrospira sp.]
MQANRIEQGTAERTASGGLKNIEAIYPLSPMQEGMLFHTLMNPGTGIYLMQNRYYVEGEMDAALFRKAWEQVIARHSILRTSFVWKSQSVPYKPYTRRSRFRSMSWTGRGRTARSRWPTLTPCCSRNWNRGSTSARRRSCTCG